jgi:2-methylcitrate dehydratase PrpD
LQPVSNVFFPSTRGVTERVIDVTQSLRWNDFDKEVQHVATRHVLDTIGVMIAGSTGRIASQAEAALAAVRAAGLIPVPGRLRRADVLDAAYLAGTAGHGIELDDGYRQGSVHPAVCVIPAVIYAAYGRGVNGQALLEAVVAGYEVLTGLAFACHPEVRRRGFHPTGVVGVLGAAAAAARVRSLTPLQVRNALGIAASSAAGLFSFINGGSDIKRLHAGHAAREGLQSVLLAEAGIAGPPEAIEGKDGFMQAFAFGTSPQRMVTFPPDVAFRITDCYIKPYACCRHLQPAVEALIALVNANNIHETEIREVRIETYSISAEHAHTGWNEYASAQLSFPYVMALGVRYRQIKIAYFEDEIRNDSSLAALCQLMHVSVDPKFDAMYPNLRPARVTITTTQGKFAGEALEALGSRQIPFDDRQLGDKFLELTSPLLGSGPAEQLLARLWEIEHIKDITPLVDSLALQSN